MRWKPRRSRTGALRFDIKTVSIADRGHETRMPDTSVPLSLSWTGCSGGFGWRLSAGKTWGWCSAVNCGVIIAPSCKNHSLRNNDILLKMRVALHPTKHEIIPAAEQALHAPHFSSLMSEGCEPGRAADPSLAAERFHGQHKMVAF